jgi:hypothetical protein
MENSLGIDFLNNYWPDILKICEITGADAPVILQSITILAQTHRSEWGSDSISTVFWNSIKQICLSTEEDAVKVFTLIPEIIELWKQPQRPQSIIDHLAIIEELSKEGKKNSSFMFEFLIRLKKTYQGKDDFAGFLWGEIYPILKLYGTSAYAFVNNLTKVMKALEGKGDFSKNYWGNMKTIYKSAYNKNILTLMDHLPEIIRVLEKKGDFNEN